MSTVDEHTAGAARVAVELPHTSYEILIQPGLLGRLGELVAEQAPAERCAVLADGNIATQWGDRARSSLESAGFRVVEGRIQPGEERKSLDTIRELYEILLEARLDRKSPVIALGGGVTGDMVGFTAATYLRGVPFVQCPTTLLAMVDSSVGGKTGVNVPQGKNLIGAFYQPEVVVIDPQVLRTLPARELRCGLAECIKHGVIRDPGLVDFIRDEMERIQALDLDVLTELVRRNVAIKAAVVSEDEKEAGVRAHLNYGHTFGHAIEATVGYGKLLHGEAVALGMVAAAEMAEAQKLCPAGVAAEVRAVVSAAGLPVQAELPDDDTLLDAMKLDKKVQSSRIRFVVPHGMGEVAIHDDIPSGAVRAAWATVRT